LVEGKDLADRRVLDFAMTEMDHPRRHRKTPEEVMLRLALIEVVMAHRSIVKLVAMVT
jgi:hypothetical protein